MIDHEILYSDKAGYEDWQKIVSHANEKDESYRRRFARRKMRRVIRQLLNGVRPNVYLGDYSVEVF